MGQLYNEILFTDGGCAGPNPSKIAGTWAFVRVDKSTDKILEKRSGIITPKRVQLPAITNNLSELYAAWKALKSLPVDWDGKIYTDSQVTLWRITDGLKFAGIPSWIETEVRQLRQNRQWTAKLLSGHPTKEDLRIGRSKRTGRPVNKWNVFCDDECNRLARQFMEGLNSENMAITG